MYFILLKNKQKKYVQKRFKNMDHFYNILKNKQIKYVQKQLKNLDTH